MADHVHIEQLADHVGETVTIKGWLYARTDKGRLQNSAPALGLRHDHVAQVQIGYLLVWLKPPDENRADNVEGILTITS